MQKDLDPPLTNHWSSYEKNKHALIDQCVLLFNTISICWKFIITQPKYCNNSNWFLSI